MALSFEHLLCAKYIMISTLYGAYVPSILNALLHLSLAKPETDTVTVFTLQLKPSVDKLSLLPKVTQVVIGH